MIINGKSVQFNYKLNKYDSIKDVPYWKLYLIERITYYDEKYCYARDEYVGEYVKRTRNEIVMAIGNFKFDEIGSIVAQIKVPKNCIIVAYPRKQWKRVLRPRTEVQQ